MKRAARADGFVLVGVVMFVLALTILGLSLFTLSSYEAESLARSHARQQSAYDAESGIEMVKSLIMSPPNYALSAAATAIGSQNIVAAVARQHRADGSWDNGSTGGKVFGDSTVWITVTARNYGEQRTLEARFKPKAPRDYYKRLFTVANSVIVENAELVPPVQHPASKLRLSGRCWQFVDSGSDTTWMSAQTTWTGPRFEYYDEVVLPNLVDYYATHPPMYTAVVTSTGSIDEIHLDGHPTGTPVAYYQMPPQAPGFSAFGYAQINRVTVFVKGVVVLMVPAGIQFDKQVAIQKDGQPATLIIVAGKTGVAGATYDYAIHFKGGLDHGTGNPSSLIMVSDSRVVIEYVNEGTTYSGDLPETSILCRDLQLMGPAAGPTELTMGYAKNTMDALIDNLYAEPSNPLPRPPGAASSLTLVRGSWRSATP